MNGIPVESIEPKVSHMGDRLSVIEMEHKPLLLF